jgi:hypothetical protein
MNFTETDLSSVALNRFYLRNLVAIATGCLLISQVSSLVVQECDLARKHRYKKYVFRVIFLSP